MNGPEPTGPNRLSATDQDERRRLALLLHDGPVQSLAGIALMLDAAIGALADGRHDEAERVLRTAVERNRDAIRTLRDLSFELEPVVLRDQGFGPAVKELADQLGIANEIRIDLDVDHGETLVEEAQVALYQIIRDALWQALRRGGLSRVGVTLEAGDEGVWLEILDDGADERRRDIIETFAARVAPLSGTVALELAPGGGTLVRVSLPAYAARA